MASVRSIVFVCLHGAAKSVIAATYLNHLSTERGLNIRATAAGIEPESEVPPQVREGLLHEGLDVRHYRPRSVTLEELAAAWRAVSFGCDLSHDRGASPCPYVLRLIEAKMAEIESNIRGLRMMARELKRLQRTAANSAEGEDRREKTLI